MATATLAQEPVVLTDCQAADSGAWTDYGGPTSAQNGVLQNQGTACRAMRVNSAFNCGMVYDNTSTFRFANYAGFAATMRIWIWLETPNSVLGAVRLRIGSGLAHYSEWDITSNLTYPVSGGWQLLTMNTDQAASATVGSPAFGSTRYVGVIISHFAAAGTGPNFAIGRITYTDLLAQTIQAHRYIGGTLGDPIDFADVVLADGSELGTAVKKVGAIGGDSPNVKIMQNTTIGEAGTEMHFTDSDKLIFFPPRLNPGGGVALTFVLTHVDSVVDVQNCVFYGNLNGLASMGISGELGSLDFSGSTFVNFALSGIGAASLYNNTVFDNSLLIIINGGANDAVFKSGGSLQMGFSAFNLPGPATGDGVIDRLVFTSKGTGHAINHDYESGSKTITLRGHKYNGYAVVDGVTGNEVYYNNTQEEITLLILDDGDIPTVRNLGIATTIISKIFTFTVQLVDDTGAPWIAPNTTEITITDGQQPPFTHANTENAATGELSYAYQYTDAGAPIRILIHSRAIEPISFDTVLPAGDSTQAFQITLDRNYIP
jgi:hypothetical protein